MATMRYQPWTVVSQLQDEINRVFGNINDGESSSATAEWVPAVDVREYSDRFELWVDLPGVDPQAVEITLGNGVLSLSGERREERLHDSRNAETAIQQERTERRQGRFYRRFILPDTADAENVNAMAAMVYWKFPSRNTPKRSRDESQSSDWRGATARASSCVRAASTKTNPRRGYPSAPAPLLRGCR